jgi:signal transduction histidine kinase
VKVAKLRSLAARVYVFATVTCVLVLVSHAFVMPRVGQSGLHDRFERDQRALADVLGLLDDPVAARTAVERIAATSGADVTVIGRDGAVIASAGAPIAADDADVTALPLDGDGPLAGGVLLMRGPPPPFPTEGALVVAGLMLALIAVVSLWFARSLARPLGKLAAAAERFGAGDLSARAEVERGDEVGQVARAFDEMAQRITSLLDANRALIANVSHELRTPMARIRVALELASESPAEAQELLAGVSGDLGELEQLVEDILTMTRLATHGVPPLRSERCAPQEIAERAGRRWQQLHGERELAREIGEDAPAIDGDPVLLRRVVDNLLDNAARHSPGERPVVLRVTRADDEVRFEVIDQGQGLTADELAHVFTPFWRSDASRTRDTGGVGLGLALARQIARAHGGDVALESQPGAGTRAILRVPRAAQS